MASWSPVLAQAGFGHVYKLGAGLGVLDLGHAHIARLVRVPVGLIGPAEHQRDGSFAG